MRELSQSFIDNLREGFLRGLVDTVKKDNDLDLQIRDNYLNLYYKGHSLLKLSEKSASLYEVDVDVQFTGETPINHFVNNDSVTEFLSRIPTLKANVINVTRSLEIEYEQLIIRANNYESRNNTDYFMVDRQYSIEGRRFDLLGVCWERNKRKKLIGIPCLIEIKYALNDDIRKLPKQLDDYYKLIEKQAEDISQECESLFRQKLQLGLFPFPDNRLKALENLTFARKIQDFRFIVLLVDYNPYSKLLDLKELSNLAFANQLKVVFTGFALWEKSPPQFNISSKSEILPLL